MKLGNFSIFSLIRDSLLVLGYFLKKKNRNNTIIKNLCLLLIVCPTFKIGNGAKQKRTLKQKLIFGSPKSQKS